MTAPTAVPPGRTRALLLVTGTGLAAVGGVEVALPPLRLLLVAGTRAWQRGDVAALTALAPDTVLAGVCAAALLTALAVWSLGVVVTLVEVVALPGRARFTLPCPALVRALTLAALGVGATVAPPAPGPATWSGCRSPTGWPRPGPRPPPARPRTGPPGTSYAAATRCGPSRRGRSGPVRPPPRSTGPGAGSPRPTATWSRTPT